MRAEAVALPESALAAGPDAGLFPIRVVAELTGINPVTIRAWERRYALVQPTRTPGSHRLYSRLDVERLRRAAGLVAEGIAIGRVARMLADEGDAGGRNTTAERAEHWLEALLARLEALDDAGMHAALDAAETERAGLATAVLDLLPARSAALPALLGRFLRSWLKGRLALTAARTRTPGRPSVLFLLPGDVQAANWLLSLAPTIVPCGLHPTVAEVGDAAEASEALGRAGFVAGLTHDAALAEALADDVAVPLFSPSGSPRSSALGGELAGARAALLATLEREAAA